MQEQPWPKPLWQLGDKLFWKQFCPTDGDKVVPVQVVNVGVQGSGVPRSRDDYVYTVQEVLPNSQGLKEEEHWISNRECDYVFKTEFEAMLATRSPAQ